MVATNRASTALWSAITVLAGVGLVWALRTSPPTEHSGDVTVFAAASLRDVMQELGSAFSSERGSDSHLNMNLAGSNVLAQQIVATPRADVFVSANEDWIDYVEAAGRLVSGTRRPLVSNRLVVIAHGSTKWTMSEATDLAKLPFAHLAIAAPDAVPAGRYARAFLENTSLNGDSLWSRSADRIAPAVDVRAALSLVESDTSTVGIVYHTDAAASGRVRILYEIPRDAGPLIVYHAALVERTNSSAASHGFFEFLFSARAHAIFERHGFVPLAHEAIVE